MPQVALGLVPKKHQLPPSNTDTKPYIPAHFVHKLEELESQVKVLQDKNQALEESYRKLSDLVEAQNHLLTSASPVLKHVPVSESLTEGSDDPAPALTSATSYTSIVNPVTMSSSTPRVSTGFFFFQFYFFPVNSLI